jgi:hypothetical protein
VTTPDALKKIDAENLDRVIILNQKLLGPIAYRGGELSLEIGLFSIKESDLAGPFLGVLESMSKTAGVSFISTALPFVSPLKDAFNLLSGAGSDSVLEIGLKKTFDPPETGYFMVMRAASNIIKPDTLKIDKDKGLVDKDGNRIYDYPYLVIRVEVSKERDDWFLIPDLAAAHKALYTAIVGGASDKIDEAIAVFHRTALSCPDLLVADAKRLIAKEDEWAKAARGQVKTFGFTQPTIREFKDIKLYK